MNNPYRLVVFDWEGTLSDSLGQVLQTTAIEADAAGFGSFDYKQARQYIHLGLPGLLQRLFPDLSPIEKAQLIQSVQQALAHKPSGISLIPGALHFIKQLQNAKVDIAIATNKGHHSLMRALQACGLDAYFKVTRCADEVPAKPCPQMLQEIMDVFGVDPSCTLMIGDSVADMEMARCLKVTGIGFDYYRQQTAALTAAGAAAVFDEYVLVGEYLHLPKGSTKT